MRFYPAPHYTSLKSLLVVFKKYTVQRSSAFSNAPNYKTLIFVNHLCLRFIFCATRTLWHNATFSPGSQQPETTLKSWHNSINPQNYGSTVWVQMSPEADPGNAIQQPHTAVAQRHCRPSPFLHCPGQACLAPPNSVCSPFQKEMQANI